MQKSHGNFFSYMFLFDSYFLLFQKASTKILLYLIAIGQTAHPSSKAPCEITGNFFRYHHHNILNAGCRACACACACVWKIQSWLTMVLIRPLAIEDNDIYWSGYQITPYLLEHNSVMVIYTGSFRKNQQRVIINSINMFS